MSSSAFKIVLALVAATFTLFFVVTIIPPLMANFDVIGALGAGFVNPYAAGYSTDVILCWVVLAIWVFYERSQRGVKHGWICILLGAVPGVVVGLAMYLIIRENQQKQ